MNKNEMELKQELFNELFTSRVKKFGTERDGKFVDVVMNCNNESLQKFFEKLYTKYNVKHSFNDFIEECIYWTWKAISRFYIRDGGSWEELIDDVKDGRNNINMGRLVTSIKSEVEPEIVRWLTSNIKISSTSIDGEVFKTTTGISLTSLDLILIDSDGKGTINYIDTISSDMNYWKEKDGYMLNQFIKWFNENKERILIKSQVNLLNNLQSVGYGSGEISSGELQLVTGFNPMRIKEYLDRIKKRTLKAWEKEKATEYKTQLQLHKEYEIELWTELIDIVYKDDIANQNKKVSDWIVEHLDNEVVIKLIYDNIQCKDIREIIHSYIHKGEQTAIPSKILYRITALVEERLDQLQLMNTTSVKFYKKDEEMGRWTPQTHTKYNSMIKEWKEQPCKVFKKSKDGSLELSRIEPYKKGYVGKTKQYMLTPTGVTILLEEKE